MVAFSLLLWLIWTNNTTFKNILFRQMLLGLLHFSYFSRGSFPFSLVDLSSSIQTFHLFVFLNSVVGPFLFSIYMLSLGEISFSLVVSISIQKLMSPIYLHLFLPSHFMLSVCNQFSLFLFFLLSELDLSCHWTVSFFYYTYSFESYLFCMTILVIELKFLTRLVVSKP